MEIAIGETQSFTCKTVGTSIAFRNNMHKKPQLFHVYLKKSVQNQLKRIYCTSCHVSHISTASKTSHLNRPDADESAMTGT